MPPQIRCITVDGADHCSFAEFGWQLTGYSADVEYADAFRRPGVSRPLHARNAGIEALLRGPAQPSIEATLQ